MTNKERANGELDKMLAIKDLLVEIRILHRLPPRKIIEERIATKQALLNDLWCSGVNKYVYNVDGTKS